MIKKAIFTLAFGLGFIGMVAAHTNPTNPGTKATKGNPGGDSSSAKDHPKNVVVAAAKTNTVTPAPAKSKIIIPSKKEKMYELKAPSIFTFTVINTFFEMPLQKK